jgi:hypothetical protein
MAALDEHARLFIPCPTLPATRARAATTVAPVLEEAAWQTPAPILEEAA